MTHRRLLPWLMVLGVAGPFEAGGAAHPKGKKKGEKPFRSTIVAFTDKAPGDWLLREAKVGAKLISDGDATIAALPDEIKGGTLLLRTSADYNKWLPPGTLKASKDGTVFVLIRWKFRGKEEVGEVAFAKLEREGWTEVDGDVATTFKNGEDWRWKAMKRDFKQGDVILQLRTLSWDRAVVLFVLKEKSASKEEG